MTRLSDGSRIDDWNRPLVPVTVEVYEPEPDPTLEVLARVLDALEGLREALGGLPAPMVHVDAPNLDALLAAIANGTPPPSADAIADAIAQRTVAPESQQPLADAVKEAFDKLDKRLQFPVTRPAAGGGAVSLSNDPNRILGHVTVDNADLDIRDLTHASDSVRSVDAAETVGLLRATFDFTAAGAGQVIVAAPGGGSLLRLRRISPTYAIRSPDSEPILVLKVGSEVSQHGNTLVGRFDDTAIADTDAITLDIDILDAGGHVTGTVYYEVTS